MITADSVEDAVNLVYFILTPGYYEGSSKYDMMGLDRYEFLQEQLKERDGMVANEEEAIEILSN